MPASDDAACNSKKQRKDRACDACRRRKTKCDGPWVKDNMCTNCSQSQKRCTYVEASKPRGPPKSYITGLEDRLEALEALLQQISPGVDYTAELGQPVVRDSWKSGGQPSVPPASSKPPNGATTSKGKSPSAREPTFPPKDISVPLHKTENRQWHPDLPPRARKSQSDVNKPLYFHGDAHPVSEDDNTTETSPTSSDVEETVVTSIAGRVKLSLRSSQLDDSTRNVIRFHGRSSTAGLVETARQFKNLYMQDLVSSPGSSSSLTTNEVVASTRRPQFWKSPPWEELYEGGRADGNALLVSFLDDFPPPDLALELIDLYFRRSNMIFPLLHRPIFMRQWRGGVHCHNIWFAAVCLSIFAVASRWSDDFRVIPESGRTGEGNMDWAQAGRSWFESAIDIHRTRRSLLHPACLFEVQTFTLLSMYIRGTSEYPTAWVLVSVGLRKAIDVGAHRRKAYSSGTANVEDELWKRAFWHLMIFDRLASAALGRQCGVGEEDYDVQLPLEVDDEYWEGEEGVETPFKQPEGVPSTITAFNHFVKLTRIVAATLKTLYSINNVKDSVCPRFVPKDKDAIFAQLSQAMDEWLQQLPDHLRWSESMTDPDVSNQSATLATLFNLAKLLIYRAVIPRADPNAEPRQDGPPSPHPLLISCAETARSCARIMDAQLRRGPDFVYIPNALNVAYVCAGVLLVNIWNMKAKQKPDDPNFKPPQPNPIDEFRADLSVFMNILHHIKGRWDVANTLLYEMSVTFPEYAQSQETQLQTQPIYNSFPLHERPLPRPSSQRFPALTPMPRLNDRPIAPPTLPPQRPALLYSFDEKSAGRPLLPTPSDTPPVVAMPQRPSRTSWAVPEHQRQLRFPSEDVRPPQQLWRQQPPRTPAVNIAHSTQQHKLSRPLLLPRTLIEEQPGRYSRIALHPPALPRLPQAETQLIQLEDINMHSELSHPPSIVYTRRPEKYQVPLKSEDPYDRTRKAGYRRGSWNHLPNGAAPSSHPIPPDPDPDHANIPHSTMYHS